MNLDVDYASKEKVNKIAKTTEELKQQLTYTGWSFDTVWQIKDGEYPTLQWQNK